MKLLYKKPFFSTAKKGMEFCVMRNEKHGKLDVTDLKWLNTLCNVKKEIVGETKRCR